MSSVHACMETLFTLFGFVFFCVCVKCVCAAIFLPLKHEKKFWLLFECLRAPQWLKGGTIHVLQAGMVVPCTGANAPYGCGWKSAYFYFIFCEGRAANLFLL